VNWFIKIFSSRQSLKESLQTQIEKVTRRGAFPKCGGCGNLTDINLVTDKKGNHGYLCHTCLIKYKKLLLPESIRNFWMCGACGYRVLAGTEMDKRVDEPGNHCPNCGIDINISLVNLSGDWPVASGIIGEPLK